MKISSRDIPQADLLPEVLKLVEGVFHDIHTFQKLSNYINKVERQGRYYRLAAELLGFIKIPKKNYAALTPLGKQYIESSNDRRSKILANAVLSSRMIQRVIPFMESKGKTGASRDDITQFVSTVTEETGPSMIPRRVSSIIAWLSHIGMIRKRNSHYVLGNLPKGVEVVDYSDDDEPLFPNKYDLSEYKHLSDDIKNKTRNISVLIDEANKDRAAKSHRFLTNMMAGKVRNIGAIPKRNRLIDLSARIDNQIYIFEMKSTTERNTHAQIRRGVSQLYEYRYIQRIDDAKLVLVVENPLPNNLNWLIDYLVDDRRIMLVWDGDRKTFDCPKSLKSELRFIF